MREKTQKQTLPNKRHKIRAFKDHAAKDAEHDEFQMKLHALCEEYDFCAVIFTSAQYVEVNGEVILSGTHSRMGLNEMQDRIYEQAKTYLLDIEEMAMRTVGAVLPNGTLKKELVEKYINNELQGEPPMEPMQKFH